MTNIVFLALCVIFHKADVNWFYKSTQKCTVVYENDFEMTYKMLI
jgi:hypothetical protein